MIFLYAAMVLAASWTEKLGRLFTKSDEAADAANKAVDEAERLEAQAKAAKRRAAEAAEVARRVEEVEATHYNPDTVSSYRKSYSRRYSFSS